MHISWAKLASFCHLGIICDPLIVSKFHNETHDPKGQENKTYTLVKGRETFYRRHKVPVTSCSEVKYVLKRVSFRSKDCTKELKLECEDVNFEDKKSVDGKNDLSYDIASGSEITPCNKICKPLVVYRFSGNVMTSITTLRT